MADVLGMPEAADNGSFAVRRASGEMVVIPRESALAGKEVPPGTVRPPARPLPGQPRPERGQRGLVFIIPTGRKLTS